MRNTLHQVRLDVISVHPYLTLKNVILLFAVPALLVFTTQSLEMPMMMTFLYCSMFATYPFMVGDKNGIDALYCTLPVRRRTVVAGRYLFTLALLLFASVFILLLSGLASLLPGLSLFSPVFAGILAAMLVWMLLTNAITLPVYFKVGYSRAKFFSYLPFFIIPIAVAVIGALLPKFFSQAELEALILSVVAWLSQNLWLLVLGAVVVLAILYYASYKLAAYFYQRRSF